MPIVRAFVVMNINTGNVCLTTVIIDFASRPISLSLSHDMGQYLLKKTIQKHYDSINALAFSPDGSLFASAADDGLIIIFQGNGSGLEVRRFQVKAPVTTLLWRSRFGSTLVAGDTSGDVHTICLNASTKVSVAYNWTWSS
jgi:WD40 repeat protein